MFILLFKVKTYINNFTDFFLNNLMENLEKIPQNKFIKLRKLFKTALKI